ncbi:MAG: hypothetical protein N4A72_20535 [Bacteroidales bacterium]|jgi:predicted metalloprotease with PDZ domain|nr:hypothetical protein [Bacteroidales bacterium]
MRHLFAIFTLITCCIVSVSASDTIYVKINLKKLADKKLRIEVRNNKESSGYYYFPKSIPGSYDYRNYGIACKDFRTNEGNNIVKTDVNMVNIPQCTSFEYYRYFNKRNFLSLDGAVAIKDSVFVFNWNSIIGYFTDTDKTPYCIEIVKPKCLKPYTTLKHKEYNDNTLTLYASNYDELLDKPLMMYKSGVKTKQFTCNSKTFNIVSFSTLEENPIDSIYTDLKRTLKIATKHIKYPNKEYTFFIYTTKNNTTFGALEHKDNSINTFNIDMVFKHNYSILYSMALHEFMHACYFPLVVKSNVIENFDYQNPKSDEHLWLYEGVNEYLSQKMKYTSGYYTKSEFIKEMYKKYTYEKINKRDFVRIRNASLTKLSKDIYSRYGRRNFGTVYNRGALVAMMLDIEIIKNSNGKMNLFDIIKILRDKYSNKSFSSNDILSEINSIVNVEHIISKYIRGRKNIDPEYLFGILGFTIHNSKTSYHKVKIKSIKHIVTKHGNALVFNKSDINKALKMDEVIILKVDNKVNPKFDDIILSPEKIDLTILHNGIVKNVTFTKNSNKYIKINKIRTLQNSNNKNDTVANRFWIF